MKLFSVIIFLACLVFPVFSQSPNSERYRAFGETLSRTAANSTDKLAYYDDLVADDGNTKNYTDYRRKYESLSGAMSRSEARLDFLIRTNDKASVIKEERDHYEKLSNQMNDLNSEYSSWLSNVE